MLSFANRVTLVKYFLYVLPNRLMQSVYISKSAFDKFNKMIRSFVQEIYMVGKEFIL